jgi:hypothetical protein
MAAKKNYPYLNLDLKSIPGERWKPIFGLEDYFMVSSFGRIKRREYEMTYKNGAVHIKREQILKPEIRWHHNRYKKDYSAYLGASPVLAGRRYNFSIARLVYCSFHRDLDYHDSSKVIFYTDGDSFHIHPSNLYVATLSEKQKRMKDLRRSPSPFHKLSPEELKDRHWQMLKFRLKKIVQYSPGGKKLKTYNSIASARRATGCNATGISRTAKGYHRTCGGFGWKYA